MGVLFRSDMIIGFWGQVSLAVLRSFRLSIRLLDEHQWNSSVVADNEVFEFGGWHWEALEARRSLDRQR